MRDWDIGLSTGSFYRRALFEVLTPIRDSGFRVLELSASPTHLDYRNGGVVKEAVRRLGDLGLEARAYHAPFGEYLDFASLNEEHRRRSIDELHASLDAAAAMQVRYFVIHPGPETDEVLSADEFRRRKEMTVATLTQIARRCWQAGIELLLENMLPHKVFGPVGELLSIRDEIGQRKTGICFDTGHAHLAGDACQVAQRFSGFLRMIHAHDNHGAADDHLLPGQGGIDWRCLLQALKEAGFNGFFSLELDGGSDRDPIQLLADAARARQWLDELWQEISVPG
jgi:sugar phosphate isomerase/epimerase